MGKVLGHFMARKRGFKTEIDLEKENTELRKINKALEQELSALKKKIAGTPKTQTHTAVAAPACKECRSKDVFMLPTGRGTTWIICRKCDHRERI